MINPGVVSDRTIVELHHLYGNEALKHLCDYVYDEMCTRIEHLKASDEYDKIVDELNAKLIKTFAKTEEEPKTG